MKKCVLIVTCCLLGFQSVLHAQTWWTKTEQAGHLHRAIKQVTDVMVYDIYSPPVTSRTYAYISVAAYEAMIQDKPGYLSFAGQLHGLNKVPPLAKGSTISPVIAAVHAVLTVGKAMVISEQKIDEFEQLMVAGFKNDGVPAAVIDSSITYGKTVASHILAWAAADRYKETRALPNYTVTDNAAAWKPTPPAYIKAIEPNWNKIRTFVVDSAAQFKPVPPPGFSTDTASAFYRDAFAVYNVVKTITPLQDEIANFWDCNPFKMNVRGHVMFATKKISPNGHWMNITRIACQNQNLDATAAAEAYACLAVALADCFISCWDEKYRSNVIRPETYINQYIDGEWMPVLQTPPFPEYTSGHSVVSSAAAVMLEKIIGNNFAFVDSTEVEFGLPPRSFTSFRQAANEAAISRFYGGIHYMPAIVNGQAEGFAMGEFIAAKLKTRR